MQMVCLLIFHLIMESNQQNNFCSPYVKPMYVQHIREHRLLWFTHVERMDDERAPVKVKRIVIEGWKKSGQREDAKRW